MSAPTLDDVLALQRRRNEAYQELCDAERHLVSEERFAAHRHAAKPDRYGPTNDVLDREREDVAAQRRAYALLVAEVDEAKRAYRARPEVAAVDAAQAARAAADREALHAERLAWPPIGWGSSDPATAVDRWRSRPVSERLGDPRPRAVANT